MIKYLKIFGEYFEVPQAGRGAREPSAAPEAPPPLTQADLDAAYTRGVQDGQTTALVQFARQSEEMMQALLLEIGTVTDAAQAAADENATMIVKFLLELLRKFFPVLCAGYGPAETSEMVSIVLAGLIAEPAVEIRACPVGIADIERHLQATPYDGGSKLTLVTVETMQPGDASIRWQSGRADRNAEALWAEILDALRLNGVIEPEPIRPTTLTLIGHAND